MCLHILRLCLYRTLCSRVYTISLLVYCICGWPWIAFRIVVTVLPVLGMALAGLTGVTAEDFRAWMRKTSPLCYSYRYCQCRAKCAGAQQCRGTFHSSFSERTHKSPIFKWAAKAASPTNCRGCWLRTLCPYTRQFKCSYSSPLSCELTSRSTATRTGRRGKPSWLPFFFNLMS